ncbi:MAG TPA: hypothetical protein VFY29_18950 [Terriglobia bacterium]|nr:hypothetical protein [Terriglobia bacterium]
MRKSLARFMNFGCRPVVRAALLFLAFSLCAESAWAAEPPMDVRRALDRPIPLEPEETTLAASRLLLASDEFVRTYGAIADADDKFGRNNELLREIERSNIVRPIVINTLTTPPEPIIRVEENSGFHWNSALTQSIKMLGVQHAFRMALKPRERADLGGAFFKDYFKTVSRLRGWDDGDSIFVNYVGHPMMGSTAGYVQIQNDPRSVGQEISLTRSYWKSRLRAFGWSFAYSTQFELGPFSEASLGNVGIQPRDGHPHPMAYGDLVVTPVAGVAWLVGEDALNKYVLRRLDQKMNNRAVSAVLRSLLNPSRTMANLLRGQAPWIRAEAGL